MKNALFLVCMLACAGAASAQNVQRVQPTLQAPTINNATPSQDAREARQHRRMGAREELERERLCAEQRRLDQEMQEAGRRSDQHMDTAVRELALGMSTSALQVRGSIAPNAPPPQPNNERSSASQQQQPAAEPCGAAQ